jgi:hypothetical protein
LYYLYGVDAAMEHPIKLEPTCKETPRVTY